MMRHSSPRNSVPLKIILTSTCMRKVIFCLFSSCLYYIKKLLKSFNQILTTLEYHNAVYL